MENNDTLALVYAVTRALTCGASVRVLFSGDKNIATSTFVLKLIDKVASNFGQGVSLEIDTDAFKNSMDIDKTLIIGSRGFYYDIQCLSPKEYVPYGVTDVICLDSALYNKVVGKVKCANLYTNFKCDKAVDTVHNIEDAVQRINLSGNNHKTILLSQSKTDIEYFMTHIKSDIVIVNVYNEEKELPNLTQYNFIRLVNYLV